MLSPVTKGAPAGSHHLRDYIVTVCSRRAQVLDDFVAGKVRRFTTAKRTRFMFQIFYRNASYYLNHLRQIERSISRIEVELHRSMKNEELFQMMELKKEPDLLLNVVKKQRGSS
jgi:magnesium transporter